MEYEFDARPLERLAKSVADIGERAKAPSPPLEKAARELEGEIKDAIRRQRGMNNERWPPKKGGGKALQSVAGDVFAKAEREAIAFGVTGPGVYHQFGERPFLPTDSNGKPLFQTGPAKAWLERTGERLLAHVLRNER